MDNLVYEDDPRDSSSDYSSGSWAKNFAPKTPFWPIYLLVFVGIYVIFFFRVFSRSIPLDNYYIIITVGAFIILLMTLTATVQKYQIFKDKLRIRFGWVLHYDIPFSNIDNVKEGTPKDLLKLGLNFFANKSGNDVVQITRKRGWKVNIIPSNRKLFLKNLNEALNEFKGHYVSF